MDVRWGAVFAGLMADYVISAIIQLLANVQEDFIATAELSRPEDVLYLGLFALSTGVGGYIAARIAGLRGPLHGLLVGVIGVLLGQVGLIASGMSPARPIVIGSVVGCLLGALGGALAMRRVPKRT
jgi:putative membrane protein (TIGR04086 family)